MSVRSSLRPLLGYLLRVALGERLLLTRLAALGASAGLALFLGSTALVERREFAAVLAANAARLGAAHEQAGPVMWALDRLVDVLALLLPRLDLLSRSAWLVHGIGDLATLGPALLQGAIYVILLGAAASFDFGRRQL
jgi:hypothetical protein